MHVQETFERVEWPWGTCFMSLRFCDADRMPGWNATGAYDGFTESTWNLEWDFATGTAFITKAKALNTRPFRLRFLFTVHDCCSTDGRADGVMN